MKKSGYPKKQISYALKQAETGTSVAEVIRRMGISKQTFYHWKKLYAGLALANCVDLSCSRRRTASSSC